MALWNRIYEHLLPHARAFFFWHAEAQLREFFDGLTGLPIDVQQMFDDTYGAIAPETSLAPEWEPQFNLPLVGLTAAQRRARLTAAWLATGGQSPRYLQDTIQAAGFSDVFIHEWWAPASSPPGPAVVRNPNTVLSDSDGPVLVMACDSNLANVCCGDDHTDASFNGTVFDDLAIECGQANDPLGYLLVNKIRTSQTLFLGCGDPEMECDEPLAIAGQPLEVTFGEVPYSISPDPDRWRYFTYFGGETYPDQVNVDSNRREEFEDLLLEICPAQQWLGVLVTYV